MRYDIQIRSDPKAGAAAFQIGKLFEMKMLKNFKLTIEYDGSAYHGWQRQPNEPSIQEEIESALMTMTAKRIVLIGSGRTDAGVHALGQVANFCVETELNPDSLIKGLNSLLPKDIVIRKCSQVNNSFHARYNAISKTYQYRILNRPVPSAICRQYAWFISKTLDVPSMRSAIAHIIGTHDFKAFEGAGGPRFHSVRCVKMAAIEEKPDGYLVVDIEADGFLRYMVRNLVGTLVNVGRRKITPEEFKSILLAKDRALAGATAPPYGLFLMEVKYAPAGDL